MDLSPAPLQAHAYQDFDGLLTGLRNAPGALASLMDRLVHRHEAELRADPSQLLQQLIARLPDTSLTAQWKREAEIQIRSSPLLLRSQSLDGPERPHLWERRPHSNLVHAIEVLPDGDTVVTAGEDGRLLCWSLSKPEKKPRELAGHQGPINHIAISSNGRWLATAGDDHMVGLWDTENLNTPKMLAGHKYYVRQVAFGGDRLFSVSQDMTARVWSLPDGNPVRTIKHTQDVMSLAVSADGEWLATSLINSAVLLWEVDSKKKATWLYGNREKVMRVMGDIYLSGTNHGPTGHKEYPHRMEFLDPQTLWTFGREWILWNLYPKPTETVHLPPLTRSNAEAAVWIDRDHMAVGTYGIQILRLRQDGEWLPPGQAEVRGTLGPGVDRCTALCMATDGRTLLSGHSNGEVHAWDLGVELTRLPSAMHGGSVSEMTESPSGRYLATRGSDDSVCVWDLEQCTPVDRLTLDEPNSYGEWCSFSPDEDLFAVGEGKATIRIRNLPDGGEHARIRIPSPKDYQAIRGLCFDLSGRFLHASISSGGLYKIDLENPAQAVAYTGYSDSPSRFWPFSESLLLTEDNFASSEQENDWQSKVYQLLAWDTERCERLWKVSGVKKDNDYLGPSLGEPVLLPEGLLTLTATEPQSLVLRDPVSGEATRAFDLPVRYFHGHRLLQDGTWFLLVQVEAKGSSLPTLLDPQEGRVLWQGTDPEGSRTVDISPNGRLAVRLKGTTLELYDPPSGEGVARFFGDSDFRNARFVLEGKRLVVGDSSGRVHLLDVHEAYQ